MRLSNRFCYLFSMLRLINTWNKTYNTRCTTHNDIQHATRPIEFTRATRSTSIFTTRQEAAETSHMQHAIYIADNMSRGGEFPSWTPPYMSGEPLRLPRQNFGRPRDAKRRHETPRDATRRRDKMPRDAMRRHKTPRDASETPRDVTLMSIFAIFSSFKPILGSPEHHFAMIFYHISFASFFDAFSSLSNKKQKR